MSRELLIRRYLWHNLRKSRVNQCLWSIDVPQLDHVVTVLRKDLCVEIQVQQLAPEHLVRVHAFVAAVVWEHFIDDFFLLSTLYHVGVYIVILCQSETLHCHRFASNILPRWCFLLLGNFFALLGRRDCILPVNFLFNCSCSQPQFNQAWMESYLVLSLSLFIWENLRDTHV